MTREVALHVQQREAVIVAEPAILGPHAVGSADVTELAEEAEIEASPAAEVE